MRPSAGRSECRRELLTDQSGFADSGHDHTAARRLNKSNRLAKTLIEPFDKPFQRASFGRNHFTAVGQDLLLAGRVMKGPLPGGSIPAHRTVFLDVRKQMQG